MTEKLKNLMDEVTGMVDQDFAAPDLDAIVRTGDRAVRRRRLVAGGVALGVLAAAATGAVVLRTEDDEDRVGFADDGFLSGEPMWTVGSTLHTPERTYDLGVDVVTLARTTEGIAYVGDDSAVYVFTGGSRLRVGKVASSDGPSLVADSDGTKVGWVEGTRSDPTFVVYDLATREASRFDAQPAPRREEPYGLSIFLAIDGSTAYWLDGRGTTETDLATGQTHVIGEADDPVLVISAQDGTTVRWIEDEDGGDLGTDVVGADGRVLLRHDEVGSVGGISPDGRWVAGLEDPSVWEVATHQQLPLHLMGDGDAIGYDWLDSDSLMVLAEVDDSDEAVQLLQCELPDGTCADVARVELSGARVALPSFSLFTPFQFSTVDSGSSKSSEVASPSSTDRPE